MTHRHAIAVLVALLVIGACTGGDQAEPTSSTAKASTTTLSTTPSTTGEITTTTSTPTPLTRHLERSGYAISDDYVVETVVAEIDSGTGGLAVDAEGNMYQGDFGYRRHDGDQIYRIDPEGDVRIFAESDEFGSLTMTTFGLDGELYQSSYGTDRIFRIEPSGDAIEIASDIAGPTGIVALEDGTVFVESYDRRIIHRIDPDGTTTEWASHPGFNGPNGLTLGPDGTLYAINHRDGGLFAIETDGTATELHRFPSATSHVAYLDGGLFVTSRAAYLIYRYDLASGEVVVVAGNAEPGDRDGRGTEASFGRPNAITVGPDGVLYFNHGSGTDNSPVTIRRLLFSPIDG